MSRERQVQVSAKVKKRFEEMQTYLGRDTEGLKKLKLLKDDVNELRTSLAAAKEQLEQAVAIKDAARERADAAEAELVRVRAALLREQQRLVVETARADAADAETADFLSTCADVDMTSEVIDMAGSTYSESVRKAVRLLRSRMPGLPATARREQVVTASGEQIAVLDREALAAGWSGANLYSLGAAVAVLVGMLERVVISTERSLRKGKMLENNNATHCELLAWLTHEGGGLANASPEQLKEVQCMLARGLRG